MGLGHSPQIVTNGLILAFDIGNGLKNATGNISTNLIQNGNFVNGAGSPNESESNPTNTIVEFANPGNSPFVLRQNGNNTEYQLNVDSGMVANTTYVMSGWYAKSSDYNSSDTMFHARAFSSSGAHNETGTDTGTLIYSTVINGITWEYRYQTIATPSDFSGSFDWYVGYGANNTAGYRYYTNLKLEKGTYPSLYNLLGTGSNGECVNGLSYNSSNGGSIIFDGTNDYVNLGTFFNYTNFTISLWVYPGSTQVQYADIFDNNHTGNQNFVCQQNVSNTNQYSFACLNATNFSGTGLFTLTANTWTFLTFTWNNSVASAYINGVFHSSGSAANPINYSSQYLRLGTWGGGGRNWNGRMSNFVAHNRVLTASEIQQNFNANRSRFGI